MQGVLEKKTAKSVLGKRIWAKKYFVLDSNAMVLSYFKTKADKDEGAAPGAIISVHRISSVARLPQKKKARFDIRVEGDHVFELRASTPQLADEWCQALNEAHARKRELRPLTEAQRSSKFWKPEEHAAIEAQMQQEEADAEAARAEAAAVAAAAPDHPGSPASSKGKKSSLGHDPLDSESDAADEAASQQLPPSILEGFLLRTNVPKMMPSASSGGFASTSVYDLRQLADGAGDVVVDGVSLIEEMNFYRLREDSLALYASEADVRASLGFVSLSNVIRVCLDLGEQAAKEDTAESPAQLCNFQVWLRDEEHFWALTVPEAEVAKGITARTWVDALKQHVPAGDDDELPSGKPLGGNMKRGYSNLDDELEADRKAKEQREMKHENVDASSKSSFCCC